MSKPELRPFTKFAELFVQKFEGYSPTSFSTELTILEKMNMVIRRINEVSGQWGDLVDLWREVMEWVLNDGLTEAVKDRLDEMVEDGTLARIINEDIFEMLNDDIRGRGINVRYPPYPLKQAKADGVTDDTEALREIFQYAGENGHKVIIPGICVITGEIEVKHPMTIEGIGAGRGYSDNALTDYEQISGFLLKGDAEKRERTRRLPRPTADSPVDPPLSVALNIQSDNVVLRDFTVFLDFDRSDASPTNYGGNWDVGIFVGTRTQIYMENVHSLGYFRQACMYFDVTHATNLPRFRDLNGVPYNNRFNISGGDGTTLMRVYVRGGKWGIQVAGAIKDGDVYHDPFSSFVGADYRGTFGFSDFTIISSSVYGTDHHSNRRRDFATGNYLFDNAGGAMFVDGGAGNASGAVQGHRYISTRFATFEPFRVRLDRSNRDVFIGCHIENRAGSHRLNPDGSMIDFSTQNYGLITATANTNNLYTEAMSGRIDPLYIPENVMWTNIAPAGDSRGFRTRAWFASDAVIESPRFQSTSGELDLRAEAGSLVRLRDGGDTIATISKSSASLPTIQSLGDNLDLRASEGGQVIMRHGTNTLATLTQNALTLRQGLAFNDRGNNIGSASNPAQVVFSQEVVIESPNGTMYTLGVSDDGTLTVEAR